MLCAKTAWFKKNPNVGILLTHLPHRFIQEINSHGVHACEAKGPPAQKTGRALATVRIVYVSTFYYLSYIANKRNRKQASKQA